MKTSILKLAIFVFDFMYVGLLERVSKPRKMYKKDLCFHWCPLL